MPRRARIHFVSLRSSLANLPISIYGPLVERGIRPQQLAVHLIVDKPGSKVKNEAYVGWTGLASASSLANFNSSSTDRGLETVEIDPQYGQSLGFQQDDVVEIGLLQDLPLATLVATEPLTADDWDIIEVHASHVESTLLSQVRVAKIDQEIDIWVLGRTRCRLKIISLEPQNRDQEAVLLTTDTQVSVAPKLHQQKKMAREVDNSKPRSAHVAKETISETPQQTNSRVFRLVPSSLLLSDVPPHNGQEIRGYISRIDYMQLFPDFDPDDPVYCTVTVKHLVAPSDPTSSASGGQTPEAKTLNPTEGDKSPTLRSSQDPTIRIACLPNMIQGNAVFESLLTDWQEWDLLRITASETRSEVLPSPRVNCIPAEVSRLSLAGVDKILRSCTDFCRHKLMIHQWKSSVGASALLLTGQRGSGKTTLARAAAQTIQQDSKVFAYTLYVDVSRYSDRSISTVKALFRYWLETAMWHRPTILILDNLHALLTVESEHGDSFRSRHLTELFLSFFLASRSTSLDLNGVIVFATSPSLSDLHPLLNSMHIFEEVITIKPPDKDARIEIMTKLVVDSLARAPHLHEDPATPLNYPYLASQTEGYSAMDLQDLVARAMHQVAIRSRNSESRTLTLVDFDAAHVDFVPLNLRDVKLQKSTVSWSDVGGLHEVRRVLRETLEWPTKYGPIFVQSPLRLRSGLLLYGYPGCGKTLLASAVAKECGLNFISVKGPEILNKYIGASEKTVRELFERASAAKPCILFFDEFDSIAPKRGHDSTGVTDRVVNQMLTQMDGAEGLDGVYVLAATSRPDLIDSALLRPGRLDKSLLCNMPDVEDRLDILQVLSKKAVVSACVDLRQIAELTEGFSGADLQALIYNANLEVIHATIQHHDHDSDLNHSPEVPLQYTSFGARTVNSAMTVAEETSFEKRLRLISQPFECESKAASRNLAVKQLEIGPEHLMQVLKTAKPSVSKAELQRLEQIYRRFVSDRSGDPPTAPEHGVGVRVSLA